MKRLSLRTIRECRFDTFPFGKTTSLPGTRPIVTSGSVNVSRFCAPPFSVITTVNISASNHTCLGRPDGQEKTAWSVGEAQAGGEALAEDTSAIGLAQFATLAHELQPGLVAGGPPERRRCTFAQPFGQVAGA